MSSELKVKAEKLRERLLDLSGKNSFIRYNHTTGGKNPNKQKYLRIVNEIPELLVQKLRKGTRYQLQSKPSEANYDFNLPFITPKTAALYKKSSKSIQVYELKQTYRLHCDSGWDNEYYYTIIVPLDKQPQGGLYIMEQWADEACSLDSYYSQNVQAVLTEEQRKN